MQEISLNILDIVQNSVSAGADLIRISVEEQPAEDRLTVAVSDNGSGMTPEQVRAVTDPFYTTRTTRKVGLGVPLFKMAAELSGGGFSISSEKGKGTEVRAVFGYSSIDRMPLGDIVSTLVLLVSCNPGIDFIFIHVYDTRNFTFDTREIRKVLGNDVSLSNGEVLDWVRDYLSENEAQLVSPAPPETGSEESGGGPTGHEGSRPSGI